MNGPRCSFHDDTIKFVVAYARHIGNRVAIGHTWMRMIYFWNYHIIKKILLKKRKGQILLYIKRYTIYMFIKSLTLYLILCLTLHLTL